MTNQLPIGVHLDSGAELVETAKQLSKQLALPFCDITGFGELEWVEIGDRSVGSQKQLQGPFQLLDLKGRIRKAEDMCLADFVCTVSRHTDNGIQVLGGRLVSARVISAELALAELSMPDEQPVQVAAAPSSEEGSAPAQPEEPSLPKKPTTAKKTTKPSLKDRWADAIAESKRVAQTEPDPDETPEVRPARGDIINHRQFGRCTVSRLEDEHITLRKPNGRQVQLGLPILRFIKAGEEDGHPIFDVEVRRKR